MISRRTFLHSVGAGILGAPFVTGAPTLRVRRRMAIVTTEWRDRSHAWHMGERFLAGYPIGANGISRPLRWFLRTSIKRRRTT